MAGPPGALSHQYLKVSLVAVHPPPTFHSWGPGQGGDKAAGYVTFLQPGLLTGPGPPAQEPPQTGLEPSVPPSTPGGAK